MTLGFSIDSFSILSWINNKKFLQTIPSKAKIIFPRSAPTVDDIKGNMHFMKAVSLITC